MDDDIVTRLRKQFSNEFVIDHPHMVCVPTLYEHAANEIELLRNDLASCEHDLNYWYERCTTAEAEVFLMQNQINKKAWWKR
jgi:hypothetical protein